MLPTKMSVFYSTVALRFVLALKQDEFKAIQNMAVYSLTTDILITSYHRLYILSYTIKLKRWEQKGQVQLFRAVNLFLLMCHRVKGISTVTNIKKSVTSCHPVGKSKLPRAPRWQQGKKQPHLESHINSSWWTLQCAAFPLQRWSTGYFLH